MPNEAAGNEVAYVNGEFLPIDKAVVSIEDRGFQFADGVYEVVATYSGKAYAMEAHLARLDRSLREIHIDFDVSGMPALVEEGLRRAGFDEALVYIQITRGVAPRHHEFPAPPPTPTVVMTVKRLLRPGPELHEDGVKVISTADLRWKRCDIKSIALLPNTLAKQQAREAGAFEALLVDADGNVTEGSSTSAFRVTDGTIYTSAAGEHILPSITRGRLLELIDTLGLPLRQEASSLADYHGADEVFLAGTSIEALAVVQVDEVMIGDGKPGPITRRLREAFLRDIGI